MGDPYERISMREAQSIVESLLGRAIRSLIPDRISEALEPERPLRWSPFPEWEQHEDLELLELTGFSEASQRAKLLVISDDCFTRPGGAIILPGTQLESLAREHVSRYRESLFGGDLIIVDVERGTMWLFHHEGYCARTTEPERP